MKSEMFTLSKNDFVKSVISAVFVGALATLYSFTSQGDFNLFTADWGIILATTVNASFTTLVGRIVEKFVTDGDGKVFGKIG